MRLCESIFNTGKVVILDSGLFVLTRIIVLNNMGVYALALIKNRRYWPKYSKGQEINNHFGELEMGKTMHTPGMIDGVKFHIYTMKEPDYVTILMSIYG